MTDDLEQKRIDAQEARDLCDHDDPERAMQEAAAWAGMNVARVTYKDGTERLFEVDLHGRLLPPVPTAQGYTVEYGQAVFGELWTCINCGTKNVGDERTDDCLFCETSNDIPTNELMRGIKARKQELGTRLAMIHDMRKGSGVDITMLTETGWASGDTIVFGEDSEATVCRHRSGQECLRITTHEYACQNHYNGYLYVPLAAIDKGRLGIHEWLESIRTQREAERRAEAARVAAQREDAARKAKEVRRKQYEQFRQEFEQDTTTTEG